METAPYPFCSPMCAECVALFFTNTNKKRTHVVSLPRWIILNLRSSHFKTLKWSFFHNVEVLIRERRLRRSSNVFAMQYANCKERRAKDRRKQFQKKK